MPVPSKCTAPPPLALLLAVLPLSASHTATHEPNPLIPPAAARNVHFGLPSPARPDPRAARGLPDPPAAIHPHLPRR
jgi:hypothetical protein